MSDPASDAHGLGDALQALEHKQRELIALVDEMQRDPDHERQQATVRRVAQLSDELSRLSAQLSERASRIVRDQRGAIEIALTPDQRETVRRATGAELESVFIDDQNEVFVEAMPQMTRDEVMVYAIEQGRQKQRFEDGRRLAEEELARISGDLRRDAPSQVRQEIDRMLADPELRRAFEDPRRRQK